MLNVYILLAAVVVLLVAAVVIASIMLVVVRERIAEVGLRKAVGATEKSIATQFLVGSDNRVSDIRNARDCRRLCHIGSHRKCL